MTEFEHLSRWVEGESVHDDERGVCVPDFSCCYPALRASDDERCRFLSAFISAEGKPNSEDTLMGMCMMASLRLVFLERLVKLLGTYLECDEFME